MISLTAYGVESTARRFIRRADKLTKAIKDASREGAELVAASARERIRPARRINAQDSPSPRNLTPRKPVSIRMQDGGMTAMVTARPHTTNARSRALVNVFVRLGRLKDLERKGLWIDPQSHIRGDQGHFQGRRKRQYPTRENLKFFRFSRHPELRRWAARKDRGWQLMRHSVRLGGDALRILVMGPSLERNRKTIKSLYAAATVRGVAGG